MDLYSKRGKLGCVDGGKPYRADAKILTDVTTQVMVAHFTPIIVDTTRHKVAPQGCHEPTPQPMPEISSGDQTPHILHRRYVTRA